jgi:hypothetical protein
MVNNNTANTNFNPNNTGQPLLQPTQPAFSVNLSANATNVTGDGTVYTIIFDSVLKDQTSSYNNGTGVFTAPVTGKYLFQATCLASGGATQTSAIFNLVATGITTGLATLNPFPIENAATFTVSGSCIISMTAGDTASCTMTISGGAKTSTVGGSASPITYFGGYLLC